MQLDLKSWTGPVTGGQVTHWTREIDGNEIMTLVIISLLSSRYFFLPFLRVLHPHDHP